MDLRWRGKNVLALYSALQNEREGVCQEYCVK